jgi:hypothetical protein
MHAYETHAPEMHAYKVQIGEIHAYEIYPCEMRTYEQLRDDAFWGSPRRGKPFDPENPPKVWYYLMRHVYLYEFKLSIAPAPLGPTSNASLAAIAVSRCLTSRHSPFQKTKSHPVLAKFLVLMARAVSC